MLWKMHHSQLTVLPGWLLLFGLSTASPTHLLSERNILDVANASSRRWNIEFDGPKGNWVGMGDSFSAGPGAGNQIDGPCKRNDKGYPAILQEDWPNDYAHTLKFISCSGAKIPDTIEKQLPQIDSSLKYATLSISGNDIGFSKILQSCIAGIPFARDCDTLLAEARTKLYSQELFDGYQQVVDGVLSRSGWQADGANRVMIYQTSYPAFFDALTPQCSSITFNPLIDTGPLLTSAVRNKMNGIQAELNTMIAFWIATVNAKYSDTFSPILYVDQDEDYTQHRFCNKDTTEPDASNPNCWFFPLRGSGKPPAVSDYAAVNPNTCEDAAGDDFQSLWICGMVRQKQENPDFDLTKTVPFEWIAKIFHPTIPGHTAVAKAVKSAMAYRPYRNGVRNLKILATGDSITFGYQSSDGNGYRHKLDDLLTESVYNMEWYGTQNAGGRLRHEGYFGLKIQELEQRLVQSGSLTNELNLVLLMVGTNDINQGATPLTAARYLGQLVKTIQSRAPDAMILIGNLIPLGASKTPIFPLDSKQRAVMEYNSYIRQLVNQGRTDGLRIAVVHSSVDQFSRADDLHPNDKGYEKMGHDWFEAIQRVNQKGLIKDAPFQVDQGGGAAGQQIAVASYTNPIGDPAAWTRLISYDSSKLSVLVANVLNGPDYVVDNAWKSVIDRAASQGKKIIGYVRTGYLGASQIEQDVDKWFELYGASLGGIFFDEGWPEYGPNNIYADLYASINRYTKRKYPGAFTVLNPGSPIAQCFENTMDTLLTFESSYETYKNSFVPNDWTPKDPRKIWHIIYKVPRDQITNIAALA